MEYTVGCPIIGANLSDAELKALTIPVAGISQHAGQHFQELLSEGGKVLCWAPPSSRLDPAAALIWVFAVGTAAAAALWAGSDYVSGCQRLVDGSSAHGSSGATSSQVTYKRCPESA